MRRDKTWWSRGLGVVLLVPLLLWLGGCWLFQIPPVASFLASPRLVEVGGTISFTAFDSEDEDGTIVDYEWSFGDGTDGTGRSVSHTYTAVGTYTVILRVTDDDGLSDTTQQDVYVEQGEPPGPSVTFTASPTSGTSPLAVYFNASGTTYTQGPLNFSWDYGDGATGFGERVSHLYVTSAGATYTVTLSVTAPDGKTGTATATITVSGPGTAPSPAGSPSARFDIAFPDTNDEVAPVRATFDPDDSEADEGRVLATYTWSFGDGDAASSTTAAIQTHTFVTDSSSEIFSVTLVVIDDEGATDDITKTVKARNHQPVAGFDIYDVVESPAAAGADPNVAVPGGGTWVADDVNITGVTQTDTRVWIRSRDLSTLTDTDWIYAQDTDDPDPNASGAKPLGYDDHNFSFDPEGQMWTWGKPAWFPNEAWGIKRLWVDWDDGNIDIIPFLNGADTVASHVYALPHTLGTHTIKVTAEDHLGAEASFERDLTLAP
jgi:PKD repeat protein